MSTEKTQAGAHKPMPNCWQCRHFAVSWDPRLPYSCKLLGFKSKGLPAVEVMRLDGRMCQGFAQKPPPAPPASPLVSGLRR